MPTASLDGRRIFISGASSGIGAATATACVAAGAKVALFARRADRLRDLTTALGPRAAWVAGDITDEGSVAAALESAAAQLGGLDGVLNFAGSAELGTFATGEVARWKEMLDTNVMGSFLVVKYGLPFLLDADHADVINMSSMAAHHVFGTDMGVYSATKAAIAAWSESLRRELGPRGVRVMVLSPGWVDTEIASQWPEFSSTLADFGLKPEDIAAQIVYMLGQPPHIRLHELMVMPTAQN